MTITVHNTQLIILKEQLIAKVQLQEFPAWLGHIEVMVKTNAKNLIASMISQLKELKKYDINHQDIKIRLWNDFIRKFNSKYNTQFNCFAESIENDKDSEQEIKENTNQELSLNEIYEKTKN